MIVVNVQKKLNGANGEFVLDLQATFQTKQIYAIFGESGSGKSTFFKMLSGILLPDSGNITFNDEIFFDKEKKINKAIWKRKIGFVFQNYALFPHLNVYKNMVFGLDSKMKGKIDDLIALLNLHNLCDKKPKNLSGGQSQKVALARAILSNPDILLLDEPFNGLDKDTKNLLQEELKKILKHFDFTTFLISHDIAEVFFLSQKVLVLQDGKFARYGTPDEVFLQKKDVSEKRICGKVLSVREMQSFCEIEVLIQNMIFLFSLPNGAEIPKIGDFISIKNHFSIASVEKI